MDPKDALVLEVRVKPSSPGFKITEDNGNFIIEVKSPPQEGKANTEIVKELRKMFKTEILILSGLKSKKKVILLKGLTIGDFRKGININP